MIELNKYKLVPGSEANAVWGGIKGDITKQTDLVQYVSEHGGGDAVWGSISGNISDQVDLQNTLGSYATQSWVSSQQFATQSWVSSQSYLTSDALTGYATESWVSSQQFATESWISSQQFVTESWVSDQGYLYSINTSGDKKMNFNIDIPAIYLRNTVSSQLTINPWLISMYGSSHGTLITPNTVGTMMGDASSYKTAGAICDVDLSSAVLVVRDVGDTNDYLKIDCHNIYTYSGGISVTYPLSEFASKGDLSEYASQSWVQNQGYIQSSASEVAPLYGRTEGYLRQHFYYPDVECEFTDNGTQMFDTYGQCYVWNIGGTVYAINFLTPEYDEQEVGHIYIYYYDPVTKGFVHQLDANDQWVEINGDVTIPMISQVTQNHFLWEDSQGRVYYNVTHTVNLATGTFTQINMGVSASYAQSYNGSKNNIIKHNGEIYLLYASATNSGSTYRFDESTQTFTYVNKLTGHLTKTFYRYGFYYNWNYYLMMPVTGGGVTTRRLVGTTDIVFMPAAPPVPTSIQAPTEIDPTATLWVTGDAIRQTSTFNSSTGLYDNEYYFVKRMAISYEVSKNRMWKLINGAWVEMIYYSDDDILYNTNGAECGDFMIGFGYNTEDAGVIPVWDFSPSRVLSSYGWDNSVETRLDGVDTRLDGIEADLGEALTITNNILG